MEVALMLASVPVTEATQAGEARRTAITTANMLGFNEEDAARVGIVASEMATNLFKHAAGGGELLVNELITNDREGIELIALDKGHGIRDVERMRLDGVSTHGTAGNGLGAMARLADEFDIYTQTSGTVVLARIFKSKAKSADVGLQHAAVSVPIRGERLCGDSVAHARVRDVDVFMVVDGLGHGPLAYEAASLAFQVFHQQAQAPLPRLLEKLHGGLRATRGAAASVVSIDRVRRAVRYAGVGNIVGTIVSADGVTTNMISQPGTLGHAIRTVTEFSYSWPGPGSTLVMHSDGIIGRWKLENYPGIITRDPAMLAALIYRDCSRGRDDATVLVAREPLS